MTHDMQQPSPQEQLLRDLCATRQLLRLGRTTHRLRRGNCYCLAGAIFAASGLSIADGDGFYEATCRNCNNEFGCHDLPRSAAVITTLLDEITRVHPNYLNDFDTIWQFGDRAPNHELFYVLDAAIDTASRQAL